ncbi:MAG: 16S rRNA (adenine(1518)-N(6)/adenine(1519)-N(6))-dimethyltransferase [Endomicrobium sp.]|jgi:16S rRNA (adenine1518-N6/adenine1519-N6)-dimethyltransferase|nr:16S rRNA (adenine(1518)-N(6)/adenine(1519)-N(6))-dimethyltransferase [Endomicrobium sp.]
MRQKHGQNFLTDLNIANNILKAAGLEKDDEVLEIGPGKGVLTKLIQPQVKRLAAVEIDPVLAQQLNHYFSFHNINNVEIINEDFLKLQSEEWRLKSGDTAKSVPSPLAGGSPRNNEDESAAGARCERPGSEEKRGEDARRAGEGSAVNSTPRFPLFTSPFKIISNLPYNVGTAIIQKILPVQNWTQCVFMLQKEVIQRLAAKPGDKDYGYISIFTQYYADCKVLFDVSPKCFNPPPKVMSSVIKLTNRHSPAPDKVLFDFIKHAFSQRRKTILNSLSSFTKTDKTKAADLLKTCRIDPMLRPDKIPLQDFLNLTEKLR